MHAEIEVRLGEALEFLQSLLPGTWSIEDASLMWLPDPDVRNPFGAKPWSAHAVIVANTAIGFFNTGFLWWDFRQDKWRRAKTMYEALEGFVGQFPDDMRTNPLMQLFAWALDLKKSREPIGRDE